MKQAQDLATFVRRGAQEGSSFDEVQRGVFHRLLDMGQAAVGLFLAPQGDGNLGPRVEVENGKTLYRSDTTVTRLLRTIFGEHVVEAYVYSAGNKRKIELRPIDARINLPHGKASYLLQEFSAGLRIPSGTPPVFLVHGGDDLISPPEHSVFMYLALKRAGTLRSCTSTPIRPTTSPSAPATVRTPPGPSPAPAGCATKDSWEDQESKHNCSRRLQPAMLAPARRAGVPTAQAAL